MSPLPFQETVQTDGLPENLLNPDDATGYKKKPLLTKKAFQICLLCIIIMLICSTEKY